MQLPLQVTFRNMEPSEALEANIREKAAKLDRYHDHIMSCRVVVEASHRHHHKGNLYHVRIDITVPGDELAVSREPEKNHAHEDPYVAVRDAFKAARRMLESRSGKLREQAKTFEGHSYGRIEVVVPEENYGRIRTPDGREVHFHRNNVPNGAFDRLAVGTEVRFTEAESATGPQAGNVVPMDELTSTG